MRLLGGRSARKEHTGRGNGQKKNSARTHLHAATLLLFANGEPPIPGHLRGQIGIVGVEASGGNALGALEQRRSGRRVGEIVGQALLRRGAGLAPMRYLGNDGADADDGLREWDEPEPAHIRPREHPDVTGAPAGSPVNSLVLRVDGDVAQERIVLVAAEALGQHAGAARGVDHHARPQRGLAPVRIGEAQRDAVRLETRVEEPVLLEHPGAALLGVAKQDLVESLAQDLKRLRCRRFRGGLKIGVPLVLPVGTAEARAPLLDEAGRRDRVACAEGVEDFVGPRQLRFADVEAREPLALQHDDAPAPLGQGRGGGGAAGPPADHRHVVVPPPPRTAHGCHRRIMPRATVLVSGGEQGYLSLTD